jgi:hypothetical protein
MDFIAAATKEAGLSARTFKSALVWAATDSDATLREEARKLLAWEDIADEQDDLHLDDAQRSQLQTNVKKAAASLRESVWRSYRKLALLGKDNSITEIDLGLITSSQADNLAGLIVMRLKQDGNIEDAISPNFLVRHWPPAFVEWRTKAVRDAFFASPQFPRLLSAEAVKDTIAKGVTNGVLAYVGKTATGAYDPFLFGTPISPSDVEISDEMFVISKEMAEGYKQVQAAKAPIVAPEPKEGTRPPTQPEPQQPTLIIDGGQKGGTGVTPTPMPKPKSTMTQPTRLTWTGEVPSQKWMNFYTKVLTRFALGRGLKLTVTIGVADPAGIAQQKIDETKVALRELGLRDDLESE